MRDCEVQFEVKSLLILVGDEGVSTVARSGRVGSSGSGDASDELAHPMRACEGISMDETSRELTV